MYVTFRDNLVPMCEEIGSHTLCSLMLEVQPPKTLEPTAINTLTK